MCLIRGASELSRAAGHEHHRRASQRQSLQEVQIYSKHNGCTDVRLPNAVPGPMSRVPAALQGCACKEKVELLRELLTSKFSWKLSHHACSSTWCAVRLAAMQVAMRLRRVWSALMPSTHLSACAKSACTLNVPSVTGLQEEWQSINATL